MTKRMTAVVAAALLLTCGVFASAEPLQTYLTYSDDPTTSIDVNFFLKGKSSEAIVHYDTKSRDGNPEEYANHVPATYRKAILEILDNRVAYVCGLKNLKPGETYYLVAGDEKSGFTKERSFRTLPGGDAPFRFITGGDMNVGDLARRLLELAAKEEPDFAVIGGDIPYTNALLKEFKDWEEWFANWDTYMISPKGRMTPIITAIGNHETNRYESDNLELRSPDYLSFFGHQGANDYFSRKLSDNAVLMVLDSGHLNPHAGAQTDWLAQEFEKYANVKYKFAVYHVPLYPTHRPYEGDLSKAGRDNWGPLFDKYGLTVGMENHDHVFKRTKPLKNNEVVDKGTVYIGDGSFGVGSRKLDGEPRWYNEKQGSISHFWTIDVRPDGISLKATDDNGKVVDLFKLP
jgi:hypothetical protein